MKKVLIIVYYFPPAGGPGVQRWLNFTKFLPEFGIEPIIFKPKNPSYPIIDKSLLDEISPNLKIVEFPIWEPYQLAEKINPHNKKYKSGQFDTGKNQSFLSKLSIFIRGNFFIPDARKFWISPSVKFLNSYLKENEIDTIITSGPPHSLHLIGLELKKQNSNLNWLADFRDPWTQISYHKELKLLPFAKNKHKKLEQKVMQEADVVIATSYSDAENFKKIGAKKSITLTNGFNEIQNQTKIKTSKFTLCYAGVLEQLRNPSMLWKVLNELIVNLDGFKNDFKLKFVGKIDEFILKEIQDNNLNSYVDNKGYLYHKESIKEMLNSDLLLICNFNSEDSEGIIPGKLFDYLATNNNILSIGPEKSDVKTILTQTNAGQHFSYKDYQKLKFFIIKEYENWQMNKSNQFIKKETLKFKRKNITKELANCLMNF